MLRVCVCRLAMQGDLVTIIFFLNLAGELILNVRLYSSAVVSTIVFHRTWCVCPQYSGVDVFTLFWKRVLGLFNVPLVIQPLPNEKKPL